MLYYQIGHLIISAGLFRIGWVNNLKPTLSSIALQAILGIIFAHSNIKLIIYETYVLTIVEITLQDDGK